MPHAASRVCPACPYLPTIGQRQRRLHACCVQAKAELHGRTTPGPLPTKTQFLCMGGPARTSAASAVRTFQAGSLLLARFCSLPATCLLAPTHNGTLDGTAAGALLRLGRLLACCSSPLAGLSRSARHPHCWRHLQQRRARVVSEQAGGRRSLQAARGASGQRARRLAAGSGGWQAHPRAAPASKHRLVCCSLLTPPSLLVCGVATGAPGAGG